MEQSVTQHVGDNGDLPADDLDTAVTFLLTASAELREWRDNMKAALAEADYRLSRYDSAIKDLTKPKPEPKPKSSPKPKPRRQYTSHANPENTAAEGYPGVSVERQDKVLAIIKTFDRPVQVGDVKKHPDYDMSEGTASNSIAHLRARGLIRLAGKGLRGAALYAPFEQGDE